jgi:hypothetical protein
LEYGASKAAVADVSQNIGGNQIHPRNRPRRAAMQTILINRIAQYVMEEHASDLL